MSAAYNASTKSLDKQFFPAECIVLWVILALAVPITLLSISSIGSDIINWLEGLMSSFSPEILETQIPLPSIPIYKLLFSFTGIIVSLGLFVTLQARYIDIWFRSVDKKGYYSHINRNKSFLSLVVWVLYRFVYIMAPVLIMSALSLLLLLGSIKFFNIIAIMMGKSLELVITLGIFFTFTVMFFWFFATIITLWNALTSIYGSIIAVTEPGLSNSLIKKRSRRFAFLVPGAWIAYTTYMVMIVVFFLEMLFLLINPGFISIKNIIVLGIVEIANILIFLFLGRSITSSYYRSLLIQYAKISVKKSKILSSQESNNIKPPDNFSISLI